MLTLVLMHQDFRSLMDVDVNNQLDCTQLMVLVHNDMPTLTDSANSETTLQIRQIVSNWHSEYFKKDTASRPLPFVTWLSSAAT